MRAILKPRASDSEFFKECPAFGVQEEAALWETEAGEGARTSGRTFQYIKDPKEITTTRLMLLADPKDPSTYTEVVLVGVAGDNIIVIHKGMQWFHIIPRSYLNGKNLLLCSDALTQEQLEGFIIPGDYGEQLVEAAETGQLLDGAAGAPHHIIPVDEAGSKFVKCTYVVVIRIGDIINGKTFRIPLENINCRLALAIAVDSVVMSLHPAPGFCLYPGNLRQQVVDILGLDSITDFITLTGLDEKRKIRQAEPGPVTVSLRRKPVDSSIKLPQQKDPVTGKPIPTPKISFVPVPRHQPFLAMPAADAGGLPGAAVAAAGDNMEGANAQQAPPPAGAIAAGLLAAAFTVPAGPPAIPAGPAAIPAAGAAADACDNVDGGNTQGNARQAPPPTRGHAALLAAVAAALVAPAAVAVAPAVLAAAAAPVAPVGPAAPAVAPAAAAADGREINEISSDDDEILSDDDEGDVVDAAPAKASPRKRGTAGPLAGAPAPKRHAAGADS